MHVCLSQDPDQELWQQLRSHSSLQEMLCGLHCERRHQFSCPADLFLKLTLKLTIALRSYVSWKRISAELRVCAHVVALPAVRQRLGFCSEAEQKRMENKLQSSRFQSNRNEDLSSCFFNVGFCFVLRDKYKLPRSQVNHRRHPFLLVHFFSPEEKRKNDLQLNCNNTVRALSLIEGGRDIQSHKA